MSSLLDYLARLLGDAVEAAFSTLTLDAGSRLGLGIPQHHVRDVDGCFLLNDAALRSLRRRLLMLCDGVDTFYEHALGSRVNSHYTLGCGTVLTGAGNNHH